MPSPITLGIPPKYRVICAGIAALVLSVGIARFAYTPLLPVMRAQAGLTDVAGGWLAAFNYAGYISGALLAASLKSLPVKFHLYRLGLILAVVTTLAMGLTDNPAAWAVLRYISGFSSTAGLLLASGLVLNWLLRNDHPPRLGLHFAGMGLGIALSGVAAQLIADRLTWSWQWVALGTCGLAWFVPAWAWMPKPPQTAIGNDARSAPPPPTRWMTLFVLAYFCAGIGYVISATFIVAIVERFPLLHGQGNLAWIVVGLFALPSSFLWDSLCARIGNTGALLTAYAIEIVSFLLPAFGEGLAANLASAALFGSTFVGIVSMTLAIIGRHYPNNPAKAMARLTLSYGVAQVAAPVAAGYIAQTTGSYRGALLMAAVGMAVGMVFLIMAERVDRPPFQH